MHLFLTGKRNVGKTTIIEIAVRDAGIVCDGFQTFDGNEMVRLDDGSLVPRNVYIGAFQKELRENHAPILVAVRNPKAMSYTPYPEAFDKMGTTLLECEGNFPLTVMDELGFMESESTLFQAAVLERLSCKRPVLGVIKAADSTFLSKVKAHENVNVVQVTVENRQDVLELVSAYVQEAVNYAGP